MLQDDINREKSGVLALPPGEYQGPVSIRRPITITGNHTVIWAQNGPAVTVESPGVSLKNLRIEVTEPLPPPARNVCLQVQPDTVTEGVEVLGLVDGAGPESADWGIPRVLDLGMLPAESQTSCRLRLYAPVEAKLIAAMQDVQVSPGTVPAGMSDVTLRLPAMRDQTVLYGDLLVVSRFTHRVSVLAQARADAPARDSTAYAWRTEERQPPAPMLKSGQRAPVRSMLAADRPFSLSFDSSATAGVELDAYVFLLGADNKVLGESSFVFHGNPSDPGGAVALRKDGGKDAVAVDLTKAGPALSRIVFAYAVYGDNPSHNFSKVKKLAVLCGQDGKGAFSFEPDYSIVERVLILLEIYRHNGEWKILANGNGYREGLKRLCENYGLEIV